MTALNPAALSRRGFLKTSLAGVGLASAGSLLAACGGGSTGSPGASGAAVDTFDVKLAWIPNVEYAGYFVGAAQGLYTKAGVTPNFVPGGPNSAVIPLIASGRALVGIEAIPENVVNAINSGTKLKIVGAQFQKSPECWVSLASAPIRTPKDIEGKRLGITLAGKNTALVFMRNNGVDTSKVNLVPIQFDPAPLIAGEIDALWGLASNQPVSLELRGHKTAVMPLADFGFNRMQDVVFVTEDTLADKAKSAAVRSFLTATQQGWQAALQDPDAAAQLVVDKYGKDLGLKLDEQQKSLRAAAPYIKRTTADGKPGYWMSDQLVQETIASLGLIKITAQSSMFTNELLG